MRASTEQILSAILGFACFVYFAVKNIPSLIAMVVIRYFSIAMESGGISVVRL
jgi:hypothetical protein